MGFEFDELSGQVLNAAVAVHRALGPGFLESVYETALCVEFRRRGIPFERQLRIVIRYLGERVGQHRLDLVVGSALVIEVKAVDKLAKIHVAQTLSYLKSSGHSVGLILNFGDVTLESKRAVRDFRSVASSRCR